MEVARTISPASQLKTGWFPVAMALGILMSLGLFYGVFRILTEGHEVLASHNDVPWNIFIVFYAYYISSIGLSYIASFGVVLGLKQFNIIAKRATFLAIILIIAAMTSIGIDMGRPDHFINLLLHPNPTSAIGVDRGLAGLMVMCHDGSFSVSQKFNMI